MCHNLWEWFFKYTWGKTNIKYQQNGDRLIDKLSENAIEDKNITEKLALKEALRNLDTKSRQIIVLRYFKDKTQIQVAKMLGISQVQVSRIEKKVLQEMRKQLDEGWTNESE